MKSLATITLFSGSIMLVMGCSAIDSSHPKSLREVLTKSSTSESEREPSKGDKDAPIVANPPATTIRFDGREVVLGSVDETQISDDEFSHEVSTLFNSERFYTASNRIARNPGVAEQVLWNQCSNPKNRPLVQMIANQLSKSVPTTIAWNGLLDRFAAVPGETKLYLETRKRVVGSLKAGELSDSNAKELRNVAQQVDHPLVMIDTLRLLALAELVAGRNAWAQSLFLQASEIADQHGDLARSSELWLMVATTANRSGELAAAKEAWHKAIEKRCAASNDSRRPLDHHFWVRAEAQRGTDVKWPSEISRALLNSCKSIGCQLTRESPVELVLWCAVASSQYDDRKPQLALVNYKKAESFASGDNMMWLRIAEGKCLASLGQTHAAAARLAEPATSSNPAIAAAATAAIGGAKLHSGVYQQAATLLAKAIASGPEETWCGRSQAEADFALAQLIIGDTDQGLESLHAAQKAFEQLGDTTSLLQSLENELQILEHENRMDDAKNVQTRILSIERA